MSRPAYPDTHVQIFSAGVDLRGSLMLPRSPRGLVILSYPSASSYLDPRMRLIAGGLVCQGFATLLLDLLVLQEQDIDFQTRRFRDDVDLLAARLEGVTDWVLQQPTLHRLGIGYFVTDTAVAAAIRVAVDRPIEVTTIVSLGGKPELAGPDLGGLKAATLLIVGQDDPAVISRQECALMQLANAADRRLTIVPGNVDAPVDDVIWERIAKLTEEWFKNHLGEAAFPSVDSHVLKTPALHSLH